MHLCNHKRKFINHCLKSSNYVQGKKKSLNCVTVKFLRSKPTWSCSLSLHLTFCQGPLHCQCLYKIHQSKPQSMCNNQPARTDHLQKSITEVHRPYREDHTKNSMMLMCKMIALYALILKPVHSLPYLSYTQNTRITLGATCRCKPKLKITLLYA